MVPPRRCVRLEVPCCRDDAMMHRRQRDERLEGVLIDCSCSQRYEQRIWLGETQASAAIASEFIMPRILNDE